MVHTNVEHRFVLSETGVFSVPSLITRKYSPEDWTVYPPVIKHGLENPHRGRCFSEKIIRVNWGFSSKPCLIARAYLFFFGH